MAEELIVGGAGEIVNRLISVAIDEFGLVVGVKDEVRKLRSVLEKIQEVMQDAEEKQVKDRRLKSWLTDLKQVAYDAEDVLDEIAYKELKYTIINKVYKFFSFPNRLIARSKIAHKIKGINARLGVIHKNKDMFQLESNQSGSSSSGQMITNERETYSYVKDSTVIGRESDKEKIIKMLINDGPSSSTDDQEITGNNISLPVISIVGLGGLGKTTLAQLVYNDDVVEKHFELRAWICVSTNFRTSNLFFQILQQINPDNTKPESSSKQVLLNELQRHLGRNKKFLLALDDDWNEEQEKWEDFVLPLGDFVSIGSKIIVTSRERTVASVKGAQAVYTLEGLSQDSCWNLIESQAFKQGGPEKTPKLVEIGKKISEKCKGVPLAAKVLGGLLHSKKEEREWLAVQNAEFWNLDSNNGNPIMEVLKLSYNNLPSTLKSCFSYCAIFPKDYWIPKELLIQLWMAQGLLRASNTRGETMEDVGNTYFKILYSKSFFQEAKINKYGEVTKSKMHDLVNDLAQFICESECQFLGKSNKMREDLSKCRHASFISPATVEALHKAKTVRTIFEWESSYEELDNGGTIEVTKISTFFKFKLLRVLDLSGFRGSDFSSSLVKLKHLRYLDLSYTSIKALPKWVTKLYHLQTLKLIRCEKLNRLPEDLVNLKKLRHLFIDNADKWEKMPQAIGKLHQLQTLPLFVSCKEVGVSMLKNLNNLRGTLDIEHLYRVKEASLAKGANLSEKSNLRKLRLHWDRNPSVCGDDDDLQVLKELQPHRNLQWLSVEGFGGVEYPAWVSSGSELPNLVGMELSNCNNCEHIPSLGELPCLKRLEITNTSQVKSIGGSKNDRMDTTKAPQSSYGSLKKLKLGSMTSLEEWLEEDAVISFPCLEEMSIQDCPNLWKAPHLFPSLKSLVLRNVGGMGAVSIISSLTSLTSLTIFDCKDLEFLPEGLLRNNHKLNVVDVGQCPKLQAFQEGLTDEIVADSSLRELMIVNCDALKSIPDVRGLTSLQKLNIWSVPELDTIHLSSLVALESFRVIGCGKLKFIIQLSSQSFKHLRCLEIVGCPNFQGFDIFTSEQLVLPCCHTLEIRHCPAISSIDLRSFVSLCELNVTHCEGLQAFEGLQFLTALERLKVGPFSMELDCFPLLLGDDDDELTSNNLLPSLRELEIWGWPALQSLPHQLQHLTMLKFLLIRDFDGLTGMPEWLGNLASLHTLEISYCSAISSIDLRSLASLLELVIRDCGGLQALQGLQFLTALEKLHIGPFSWKLDCFPLLLGDDDGELTLNNPLLPSLRELEIWGWPALQFLPHHLQRLTLLKSLTIWKFTNLTKLPEWLGNLASLERLLIWNCENLSQLPSKEQMQRLTLLEVLDVNGCPRLKERCSRDGPEWPKISHIPCVRIRMY